MEATTSMPPDSMKSSDNEVLDIPNASSKEELSSSKKNCQMFQGHSDARGIAFNGSGRGAITISHIYISTAFIYLATQSAGCNVNDKSTCNAEVYGFKPSSLVAMIATASGILAAFLMPLIGAIIDYTPHRKTAGILSAVMIWLIQFAQIWTNSQTWFAMLILQAINGFVYQVQFLATFSYFPEIADVVGQQTMNNFISKFRMIQFGSEVVFIVIITALSLALKSSDVILSSYSQILSVIWIGICFYFGWKTLPQVPPKRVLRSDQSVLTAGFIQTLKTVKNIHTNHGGSLRWYFLAVIFSEAGANAFTALAVTFMNVVLKMSSMQIGIMFLVVLVFSIPGTKVGEMVTNWSNPKTSWRLCLAFFSVATAAGSFVLSGPERQNIAYLFGILWGLCLGWFYPVEELMFSMTCPAGVEAELTGFYVYCTNILAWLPPLIFTSMNQHGVSMQWGLLSLVLFFVIGIVFIFVMDPWDKVIARRTSEEGAEMGNVNVTEGGLEMARINATAGDTYD